MPPATAPIGYRKCHFTGLTAFLNALMPKTDYPGFALTICILCVFGVFVAFLAVAGQFPIPGIRTSVIVVGSVLFLPLAVIIIVCLWSYFKHRHTAGVKYKPALGNTLVIVLLTIPIFTALYVALWYPQLRSEVLVTSTDLVSSVRFPSVVLFQRKDWSSQANLLGTQGSIASKCYLGWYNDNAPMCVSLDPTTFGNTTDCICSDLWYNDDQVIEDFEWMGVIYRYIVFNSPDWLLCNTPTYLLLLQTFFNYNVTQATQDSSASNPTLLLAVYDPALGMQKSFDQGYTRMNLINAFGIVAVNIGLRIRQAPEADPAYDYTLDISSSPATDLVCDTSTVLTYKWPCHISLFVQIPNFERTTIIRQKQMSWADAAASAGAYFSFVQFLSWLISFQAFMP